MQIHLSAGFHKALDAAFIGDRLDGPSLTARGVLWQVTSDRVTFVGSDGEITVLATAPCRAETEQTFILVPEAVKELRKVKTDVTLHRKNGRVDALIEGQQKTFTTLRLRRPLRLDPSTRPVGEVVAADLREALASAFAAPKTYYGRYALNHVRLTLCGDTATVMALDTCRFAATTVPAKVLAPDIALYMTCAQAVSLRSVLAKRSKATVRICSEAHGVERIHSFHVDNCTIIIRSESVQWPGDLVARTEREYQAIAAEAPYVCDAFVFRSALASLASTWDKRCWETPSLRVTFEPTRLAMTLEDASVVVPATGPTNAGVILYDLRYLRDFAKYCRDTVRVCPGGSYRLTAWESGRMRYALMPLSPD